MGFETLFPFVLVCAVSDVRTHRIPNTLILCGLAGALLSRRILCGLAGALLSRGFLLLQGASPAVVLADGLAGFLLPWLLFGPLALLKMMGGGDVKLLSAAGLWLGARGSLQLMWYSLLFAAVWSAAVVIRHRNLFRRLRCLYEYMGRVQVERKRIPYRTGSGYDPGSPDHSGEICFAVPVLAAFVVLLL